MKAKFIEIMTWILFFSGIALWDKIEISRGLFKFDQLSHILVALVLFIFVLLPFVYKHLSEHKKMILKKRKGHLKRKQITLGSILGLSLIAVFATGVYLFLVGNRGGDIYGMYSLEIHFYGSFILTFLLFYHSYYLGRRVHHKHVKKEKKC